MGSIFPCSCLKINIGRKEKFASLFNDRLTVLLRELLNKVWDLGFGFDELVFSWGLFAHKS